MNYTEIISTLIKLLTAIIVGFMLHKKGILDEQGNQMLSQMILKVTCPALIIYSVCNMTQVQVGVIQLLLFGVVLYVILPVFAHIIVLLMKVDASKAGVYELLIIFGNVNFMGYPIVQAMYGNDGIFYATILHLPFNILIFTYGKYLLNKQSNTAISSKNDVISMGMIASIIALFIYLLQIPVPVYLSSSLQFIGNITTPLSMIVIGSIVAGYAWSDIFRQGKLYILVVFKLLIIPIVGYLFVKQIFDNKIFVGVITLTLAMPSGSLCVMLSKQYGNGEKEASLGVLITTMLSLITLPCFMIFMQYS